MHHLHIDRFASLSSPVHRIDPRVKLITTLIFIVIVVLTPNGYFLSYGLYFAAVLAALYFSNVPGTYIFKRSLTIIPFAVAISFFVPFITPGPVAVWVFNIGSHDVTVTMAGLVKFSALCSRAFISFFAVITLVSSTRFGDLMWAAGRLRFPAKLIIVVSFMYRYLFIIIDEVSHMILARDLRSPVKKRNLLMASGGIVGALLARSFEHAEKLYYAMLLRGYTGDPVTVNAKRIRPFDIVISLLFIGFTVTGLLAGGIVHV